MLAAFDQVPPDLHDNSLILGLLSCLVGSMMVLDLADPMARHVSDTTQTETRYLTPSSEQQTPIPIPSNETISANPTTNHESTAIVNSPEGAVSSCSPASQNMNLHVNIPQSHTLRNDESAQTMMDTQHRHAAPLSSPEVVDIAKNGNYHRSDSIDFVHTRKMPTIEQPVFERILMPEKKRPTFQIISEPSNLIGQNVHMMSAQNDEQTYYNRHRILEDQTHHQRSTPYNQPHHIDRQRHVHKPYHNHGYDDYNEQSDNPPPRYVLKSSVQPANTRYRDNGGTIAEPMVVIRNYSQPMHIAAATMNHESSNHSYHETKAVASSHCQEPSMTTSANNKNIRGYAKPSNSGDPSTYKQASLRSHCKRNDAICDSSDDDVDFRKMNSAIRPGFVANAAKMWDQRATHQREEFNTIV